MLVNAGLVRKGIGADDRLVGRNLLADDIVEQLRSAVDLRGDDVRMTAIEVSSGLKSHDDLFERGVARPFADPVDCTLDLPHAGCHRGQGIGYGKSQVVVIVGRKHNLFQTVHADFDLPVHAAHLLRRAVAHRIGQVNGACAAIHGRLYGPG